MSTKPIILLLVSFCLQCSRGSTVEETAPTDPSDSGARSDTDTDTRTDTETTRTDTETREGPDTAEGADPTDPTDPSDSEAQPNTDTGTDTAPFDAQTPTNPIVSETAGSGNVTTYGSVSDPAPSQGGACNYGETQVLNFAAINVNVSAGDGLGQWNLGHICGQCAEVTAHTAEGDKTIVVRIMDKCPDEYCGIDLGGAPAAALMGTQPGRYNGTWEFVPCADNPNVSDGSASIFVKEGSNPWWALIQVRNPPAAVKSINWTGPDGTTGEFVYATEAENFYTVPEALRTLEETVTLTVTFDFGIVLTTEILGTDLTVENASYEL